MPKSNASISGFTFISFNLFAAFLKSLGVLMVITDGEITVSHDTHGKDKINPDKICEKLLSVIN